MNKVVPLNEFHIENIIVKAPKPMTETGQYISEIWYRHQTGVCKPIIQTPRLKIKYGAKKHYGSFGYCLDLYNRDIDPDIEQFFELVRNFDKKVIAEYTEHRKEWGMTDVGAKYWSAMRRKGKDDPYYFQLKLINDKDGNVETSIFDTYRTKCDHTGIKYGRYADQFIGPGYIIYNKNGIYPCWSAHQIVLSEIEKVFLAECLLDQIVPPKTLPPPALYPSTHTAFAPPISIPDAPKTYTPPAPPMPPSTQNQSLSALSTIKVSDITDAMKRLKSVREEKRELKETPLGRISAEELQEGIKRMKERTRAKIMTDSIKGFPVPVETRPRGSRTARRIKITKAPVTTQQSSS